MYILFLYLQVPSIVLEVIQLESMLHLSRRHLESNVFSKDNVSNVNTMSNPDHIDGGPASTLHSHAHFIARTLCRKKCNIQGADGKDAVQCSDKLLCFRNFLPIKG